MTRNALVISALTLLLIVASCRDGPDESEDHMDMPLESGSAVVVLSAAQVHHGGVQWQAVVAETVTADAVVPGTIVPDEDRTARLGAPAQGRVVAVRVRPGDRVQRGQLLVTLHSPEAGAALSDVQKAEAELAAQRAQSAYAKSARDRAERLLALKAISRQDYERALADDEMARAAETRAAAELQRARSTARQLGASVESGTLSVRSPLSGVVLSRTAVPGTVVDAGTPLVSITDPASLWLLINAPEAVAHLFQVGATVSFTVPAFGDEAFTSRVEAIGAGLDPASRTIPIRAAVANGTGRLRPEMFARVMVTAGQSATALMLPADAVQLLRGKTVVFIAEPDQAGGARFTAREVQVGARAGDRIPVIAGLQGGERVVTRGALAVKAQMEKAAMPELEM